MNLQHSENCSIYLPLDRTCDCGAARIINQKDPDVCWHCGIVLYETDRPRCEGCPAECDEDDCDQMGCVQEREEQEEINRRLKSKMDDLEDSKLRALRTFANFNLFSPNEKLAIKHLSEVLELSEEQVIHQALKEYQLKVLGEPELPKLSPKQERHRVFHKLWTRDVGSLGYNKEDWLRLETLLNLT